MLETSLAGTLWESQFCGMRNPLGPFLVNVLVSCRLSLVSTKTWDAHVFSSTNGLDQGSWACLEGRLSTVEKQAVNHPLGGRKPDQEVLQQRFFTGSQAPPSTHTQVCQGRVGRGEQT